MTDTKAETKIHPAEAEIADFLDDRLPEEARRHIEEHMASCGECLEKMVSAHESVKLFRKGRVPKKGKVNLMKNINIYLVLAVLSFALSFVMPRFFLQLLVATLLLGIKWIVDSKTTKMLVMIYEAWKKGGEKEASRIFNSFEPDSKHRF